MLFNKFVVAVTLIIIGMAEGGGYDTINCYVCNRQTNPTVRMAPYIPFNLSSIDVPCIDEDGAYPAERLMCQPIYLSYYCFNTTFLVKGNDTTEKWIDRGCWPVAKTVPEPTETMTIDTCKDYNCNNGGLIGPGSVVVMAATSLLLLNFF